MAEMTHTMGHFEIEACGLRSPSFESSSVLYITPTVTPSMQELIKMAMQQKLQKFCYRCDKSTWHVESNHIFKPPKYFVLGPHRFSLLATIDHHGPSMYSGHYTTSVNCCKKKHSIAMTAKLRSLKCFIQKTPLLRM